ncbi:MAG: hypothetical protein JWQ97_981 [Phenylobacterium sp.]|nr:hypothetical protein [Phenylobacterium sp.]
MMRATPKQLADARAMLSADRKARAAERKTRVEHKADPVKVNRGRVRDNGYLAYLRRQPCEACGAGHRVEAAHIRSGYAEAGWPPTGMQVKPSDFRALSLCASCHREGPDAQHRGNERLWWQARGIYPPERCAQVRADFLAGRDQGGSHAAD